MPPTGYPLSTTERPAQRASTPDEIAGRPSAGATNDRLPGAGEIERGADRGKRARCVQRRP